MLHRPIIVGLAAAVLATACSTTTVSPSGFTSNNGSNWWRQLGDPQLDALVREALENSPTVDVLAARVEVARADASLNAAAAQPSVSAGAARGFGERQEFETAGRPAGVTRYAGGARFAWELDFWGRVGQLRKGARQKLQGAFAREDAGRLILISEIAHLDFSRRRLDAEENVVAATLAANNASLSRLREKQLAGIIDDNLTDRQSAEGDALRREIEELRRQRRLAELGLDRLLGRKPGASEWPTAPTLPNLPPLTDPTNTDRLAARPDLRASMAEVAATWHLSKAATLDLLPKLKFTGLASGRTMQLTPSVDEWIAQVAPTLEIPIWDATRRAQASGARARAKLAAAEYREDVLRAIGETSAALNNLSAHQKIQHSAEASANSLHTVYERTREKFNAGLASQLDVLDDQRRALEARRASLQAKESQLASWINLQKALGG